MKSTVCIPDELSSARDFLIVLRRISATKAKPIDAAMIVPVSENQLRHWRVPERAESYILALG